jgi:hypothetical protein
MMEIFGWRRQDNDTMTGRRRWSLAQIWKQLDATKKQAEEHCGQLTDEFGT